MRTGRVYPANPGALCVEKEVYTLLHDRKRDDSCDRINNDVEGAIGDLYRCLQTGVDLNDEQTRRKVFTTLAVFTANLIAHSRVLRNYFNGTLDAVNGHLTQHPDFLVDFPEDEYQKFLQAPQELKGDSKAAQALRRLGDLLRECDRAVRDQPFNAKSTVEALKQLIKIHYPILLKPRTGIMPEVMQKAGVKGDLLVPESGRFISADDPVIFIVEGGRATNINPADIEVWAAPIGASTYLCGLTWQSTGPWAAVSRGVSSRRPRFRTITALSRRTPYASVSPWTWGTFPRHLGRDSQGQWRSLDREEIWRREFADY